MRNRCFSSLSVTVEHLLPSISRGVKSCWTDIQLLTGRRWDRVMLFQLWLYNSAFQTISFTAMSCLNGWTLLSRLVSCPWKIQQELLEINHMTRRKQSLDFVSCIAVGYTCNSADKCISLNHCFHLKSLHLAPNLCWRYTMGYLNIFMHTQNNNTRATEKSHRDKINFFLHFQRTSLFLRYL